MANKRVERAPRYCSSGSGTETAGGAVPRPQEGQGRVLVRTHTVGILTPCSWARELA